MCLHCPTAVIETAEEEAYSVSAMLGLLPPALQPEEFNLEQFVACEHFPGWGIHKESSYPDLGDEFPGFCHIQ